MLNLQDYFVKFGSATAPGAALPSRIPALVTVGVTTASPKFNEIILHLQHLKRPRYVSNCLF